MTKHEMGTETAEDENKRTTNEGEKFTKERLGPLKGMSSWVSELKDSVQAEEQQRDTAGKAEGMLVEKAKRHEKLRLRPECI